MSRKCGDCSLCCRVLGISALDKAPWKWCDHCPTHRHCNIYPSRPEECRTFDCLWVAGAGVPKWMQPSRTHVVLMATNEGTGLMVLVDPSHPDAWLKRGVYDYLRLQAALLLVIVSCGSAHYVVRTTGHRLLGADEVQDGPIRQFTIKAFGSCL